MSSSPGGKGPPPTKTQSFLLFLAGMNTAVGQLDQAFSTFASLSVGPGHDLGISNDWLWFHSWVELGSTTHRVSISVQGLSTSSPIGCQIRAAHIGVLPREAARGCPSKVMHSERVLILSILPTFVLHLFFRDWVSNHMLLF